MGKETEPVRRRGRSRNHTYKRMLATNGYVQVWVGKGHRLADSKGCAYEHRVVAEQKLGRQLRPGEVVHHINEDRTDNRPENLEVFPSHAEHNARHRKTGFDLRLPGEPNPTIDCGCGCGATFPKYDEEGRPRRYLSGHNPSASPLRDAILSLFDGNPGRRIRAADVVAATGRSEEAAYVAISRLCATGKIIRVSRGLYGKG